MGKQLSPASRTGAGQWPYLRVANVYEGRIDYSDVNSMAFSAAERETYGIAPGDILLNEGQENLMMVGRSALYDGAPGEFGFQNTLIRFRPGPAVVPEFAQAVFVWWRANAVFAGIAEKTSISHLGGSRFGALLFPLIPVAAQRRIVEVLASFTELERGIEASIAKFEALRFGVMEELAELECGQFGDVLKQGPQNGIYKPASSYGLQGTPIVRIDSFSRGKSDLTRSLLRVAVSSGEVARYGLDVGDIVINRVNTPDLVGKSTSVRRLIEPTIFESNMMRCKLHRSLADPVFTETWLGSSTVKRYFLAHAKSAISQASINGDDVRNCPFPKMDVPRQLAFLERIDAVEDQRLAEVAELAKLRQLKQGLVDDLLSGRRSVFAEVA
ncbi:restriction endonuclease subunit S [Streptomyces sp. NBC_01280]|uniref:restriction endonuclease subunit S n=1 Tax=Streptomyces sp. NBC_01280 TaxID=2903810 RepID=UPI002E37EBBC|nr:restriction endonuclease subunit S [Streptomyces sp. NBC_01280]